MSLSGQHVFPPRLSKPNKERSRHQSKQRCNTETVRVVQALRRVRGTRARGSRTGRRPTAGSGRLLVARFAEYAALSRGWHTVTACTCSCLLESGECVLTTTVNENTG
jgi:hypothetical protein